MARDLIFESQFLYLKKLENMAINKLGENNSPLFFENQIERKWLSTEEASRYLCISENALRIMVHRGQIRTYKFGRRLRFLLNDFESLLKMKGAY
jgi:excisionase family DNA binding protein